MRSSPPSGRNLQPPDGRADGTGEAVVSATRQARVSSARRRLWLAVAACLVIAAGLAVTRLGTGAVADAAGDVLYAALVYLLLAFVAPRARGVTVAGIAFLLCAAVELTQLTGLPATLVDAWGPLRYVLGTTFALVDLFAYGMGVAFAWAAAMA